MTEYKTLREMKIKRPDQIDRYSVQSVDNTDVFLIRGKR